MNTSMPTRRMPTRYDLFPFDTLLREVFADRERNGNAPTQSLLPAVEIAETDKDFVVAIDLPGFDEKDVQVRIAGSQLVVSGERKQKKEDKDKHYHRVETTYGAFERRFELPDDVRRDIEGVRATSHKGVLEVRLAKVEPRPAAKIPIQAT